MKDLRKILRLRTKNGKDTYEEVKMKDLKDWDIFKIEEHDGFWMVKGEPWQKDGVWGVDAQKCYHKEKL